MRIRLLLLLAALISVVMALLVPGASRSAARQHRGSSPTTAANREAAIRDAARLLGGVVAPPGAVLLSRSSAVGIQPRLPVLTPASASALSAARWRVPEPPGAVLSFVEAHLPPGSTLFSSGSSGPHPQSRSVIRAWAPVPGVLDTRWLELVVTAGASGGSTLSAESQSQWVIVRPAAEHIGAGIRSVTVAVTGPRHRSLLSRTITAGPTVARLVTLFDALGIVQPVAINCPAQTPTPMVTVSFWSGGSRASRPSAVARVSAGADFHFPPSMPGWSCDPIALSIDGHAADALIGNVIAPLDRLLRVHLETLR